MNPNFEVGKKIQQKHNWGITGYVCTSNLIYFKNTLYNQPARLGSKSYVKVVLTFYIYIHYSSDKTKIYLFNITLFSKSNFSSIIFASLYWFLCH